MKNYLLHIEKNIKESLIKLEKNSEKCLIIVDSKNILKGTLTDGDVRRAMLDGASVNSKVKNYIKKKPFYLKEKNFTRSGESIKKLVTDSIKKIKDDHIDIIPVLDENHKVKEIIVAKDFSKYIKNEYLLKNIPALIMACLL